MHKNGNKGVIMYEFPVKPLMTFELMKILFVESATRGVTSFYASPILGSFKLCW